MPSRVNAPLRLIATDHFSHRGCQTCMATSTGDACSRYSRLAWPTSSAWQYTGVPCVFANQMAEPKWSMWAWVNRIARRSSTPNPSCRNEASTSSRLPGKPASISMTPLPSVTSVQLTRSVCAKCTVSVMAVESRCHLASVEQWSRNEHVAELKLGYKASAEQFAPRELVELAVAAEAHGMDSATVSDHFQPWRHEGGHAPFSLAWMTAVGERTKRLILGTSVLTPTFRYNPAVIAQAFATMGCLYPDRIFLGVGTGEALNEIATGYEGEWPEFKERYARLRESVRADARAVARRPGRLRRRVLPAPRARRSTTCPRAASRSTSPRAGRRWPSTPAARATASSAPRGKGEELYKDKLIPAMTRGRGGGGQATPTTSTG